MCKELTTENVGIKAMGWTKARFIVIISSDRQKLLWSVLFSNQFKRWETNADEHMVYLSKPLSSYFIVEMIATKTQLQYIVFAVNALV